MKFWNKIENDIFIYGDIAGEKFFESDVTAKEFADDLKACKGPVTVHINSNGGDCFTALAIANLIKSNAHFVTVSIEGICASAATIISSAGHKVLMAENALMMIHLPSVGLCDFYDEQDLEKIKSSLDAVKNSILESYKSRTGLEVAELEKMLTAETWLSAAEAKELNFVDEIVGEVQQEIDNAKKLIIINKVTLNQKYYQKVAEKMENQSLFEKFKAFLAGESEKITLAEEKSVKNAKNPPKGGSGVPSKFADRDAILTAERQRVKNLQEMRCDNVAIDKIIDVAISNGAKVSEVQGYIDALKTVDYEGAAQKKFMQMLQDNLTSGAEKVVGSVEVDKQQAEADLIASFANKLQK